MANDNHRSQKVKNDERIKSKKKMATQDASPETSSSKRASRETASSKQAKEIPSSTRKSKRLEKNKPSDSPPIFRKSKRTQEQMTTPLKRYDRRKKNTSVGSSGTKKLVEEPTSSSMKSKNEKVKRNLKMDSKEDKRQEKQSLDVGGRKRKRAATSSVDKALSRSSRRRTEASNDNDKESQDESSQATSSSNRDVDNSKNENSGSKSVENKGDDEVEECSDRTGEESAQKASEAQCSTSNSSLTNFSVEEINDPIEVEESPNSKTVEGDPIDAVKDISNDRFVDLEQVEAEHVGSPSKKSIHGESIENGSVTVTPNSGKGSSSSKKTDPDVSTDIKEFWVPVQISNVQLEQYCSMLLTNAMALSSCSKSDTVGALHDILVSNRKCCDHPYIVDQSLQGALTKDLEPAKFLEVGIKASGKLQFLDLILPEMRKRELRVLILFQPLSGSGKDSTSIGDILDDFVRQRFGEDSYERVDAVITTPSKRHAALNNFNNKEMGRFIFLLDYRACLPSIKLSSVDTVIIFDSEWNPANDLRALQKIAIDSHQEQIKIFRLYTSWTLEEKILKLSEHNATIDKGLQSLSRNTCDALLMWGATYLFSKLTEFHHANTSSEDCFLNELMVEFLNLNSDKHYPAKLIITRVQQSRENLPMPNELPDGEQPHTFWKKLLAGRDPCWKYLTTSTPRQRKRPQFYESIEKTNASSDDVGRKRKKTTPVTEKGEIKEGCTVISSDGSQLSPGDSFSCDETSFRHLLKLNISELCRVLKLSEEVKKMVERFLEYVIENYQVNKEPANTVQAFLISLCWIGCALLKKKVDRKQSLSVVRKRLNFTCEEEETNSVYLKLEQAKEMFLIHTHNQKKSNEINNPHVVKVEEIRGSPEDEYVTISPDMSDVPEDQNDSHDSNNNNSNSHPHSPPAPASQQKVAPPAPVQPLVSPNQDNLQTKKDAEKVDDDQNQIISEAEQQHNEAPPQVLETTADDPNHTATQSWPNLFNHLLEFESHNRGLGPTRMLPSSTDPLQAELEKLSELKNTVNNFYEAIKVKLKAEYEKERAEILARLNRKYDDKSHKAELAFHTKKNEIDINLNKVVRNKILADAFRSKCRDLNPFDHSQIQREMQHLHQFHGQHFSSPGQSSGSNKLHQTPHIVHQSANLFSHTPTRPQSYPNPITPPPSNISTTIPPPTNSPATRLPPNMNHPSSTPPTRPPQMSLPLNTPNKPPPNITSTTPSIRNTRVTGEIRAPAPHIRPFKPSTEQRVMLGQHGSSSLPPSSTTFSHTPSKPPLAPPSQTPTNHTSSHPTQPVPAAPSLQMPTNHNSHPAQPQPVAPPPPSEQHPPATLSSSLPPMPSVSVSHTGLYSSSSPSSSGGFMNLLMDVDKEAGFHQKDNVLPMPSPSPSPSPSEVFGKCGDGDLVCLSDDD
ncbi:unnamed protein product [Lactuca virosa]|uniref:Helicase C-terminal domain-containing protein n=1 Tax=Lactuca virosa TaxID=75947 RepID=A0AAU9NJE6_9ASTR|nr:unnamed protein product [Lactuca virosa]